MNSLEPLVDFLYLIAILKPFQVHQLQLVSLSSLCSFVFSVLSQITSICRYFRFISFLLWGFLKLQDPFDGEFFFFSLINAMSGQLEEIRCSISISKSQRILCISFSRTDSGLCIYHFVVWSNFNLLHNSLTKSHLFLFSFCASVLHSHII